MDVPCVPYVLPCNLHMRLLALEICSHIFPLRFLKDFLYVFLVFLVCFLWVSYVFLALTLALALDLALA